MAKKQKIETEIDLSQELDAIYIHKSIGDTILNSQRYDLCCKILARAKFDGVDHFLCEQDEKYTLKTMPEMHRSLKNAGLVGTTLGKVINFLQQEEKIPFFTPCEYLGIDQHTFEIRFPPQYVPKIHGFSDELFEMPSQATYEECQTYFGSYLNVIRAAARGIGRANAYGLGALAPASLFSGRIIEELGLFALVVVHGKPDTAKTSYCANICNVMNIPSGVVYNSESLTPAVFNQYSGSGYYPLVVDDNKGIEENLASTIQTSTTIKTKRSRSNPLQEKQSVIEYRRAPFVTCNEVPLSFLDPAFADRLILFHFPARKENFEVWMQAETALKKAKGSILLCLANMKVDFIATFSQACDLASTYFKQQSHNRAVKKAIIYLFGNLLLEEMKSFYKIPGGFLPPNRKIIQICKDSTQELMDDECSLIQTALCEMEKFSCKHKGEGDPNAPDLELVPDGDYMCYKVMKHHLISLNKRTGLNLKGLATIAHIYETKGLKLQAGVTRYKSCSCRYLYIPTLNEKVLDVKKAKPAPAKQDFEPILDAAERLED